MTKSCWPIGQRLTPRGQQGDRRKAGTCLALHSGTGEMSNWPAPLTLPAFSLWLAFRLHLLRA
jgi:hypothetical protein